MRGGADRRNVLAVAPTSLKTTQVTGSYYFTQVDKLLVIKVPGNVGGKAGGCAPQPHPVEFPSAEFYSRSYSGAAKERRQLLPSA